MYIIKSDIVALHGAANSMQGGRSENQDDWGYTDTPLGCLIIICDGMGGGPAGKTASYIVKNEIALSIRENGANVARDHAFKVAVARAHEVLEQKMQENPAMVGMGSTFVAVLLSKQSAMVAHAGDSRFYRFRGKKCIFRSNDHSLVAELVKKKALTEEQARISPQSNVITRGLGSTSNHVPEIDEMPFCKGDRLVLCTDGVWGIMPHKDLLERFTRKAEPKMIVESLSTEIDKIGFAKGGGHDNHTIAVIDLEGSSVLKDKVDVRKIAILSAIVVLVLIVITCFAVWISRFNDKNNSSIGFSVGGGFGSISSYDSQTIADTVPNETLDTSTTKFRNSPEGCRVKKDTIKKEKNSNDSVGPVKKGDKQPKQETEIKTNKNTVSVEKQKELSQKLANRFIDAQNVKEKKLRDATDKMASLHASADKLIIELKKTEPNKDAMSMLDGIANFIRNEKIWYIARSTDADSFYVPTSNAKDNLKKMEAKAIEIKNTFK